MQELKHAMMLPTMSQAFISRTLTQSRSLKCFCHFQMRAEAVVF